ncbi:MAG: HPF/RaiA family ribosome-associated protein [Alphaproteobacteria bacterium]|jgi:cold shock CspA family protein|nr:HPF/RaiA family ribosome-associated protein [Alphaproteobacteria bacterium]
METLLEIVFEGIDPSPAIESLIREEMDKLEQYFDRITSARVVFAAPHHAHNKGNVYAVRIHLEVPGQKDLAISRNPGADHRHEDAYLVVRDAFRAARRRLKDRTKKQRGKVKVHEAPPTGRVARLFPDGGYGFIETIDEREVYFHRNSVVTGSFDRLAVGAEVRFAEEMGEDGPQASTVHVLGKRHPG